MLKRSLAVLTCFVLTAPPIAGAVPILVDVAQNDANSIAGPAKSTKNPNGDAPAIAAVSCGPTFTCAEPNGSEINEVSSSNVTIVANTVNTETPARAYVEMVDSSDAEMRLDVPASFGAGSQPYAGTGIDVREGATGYRATCWCQQNGNIALTYGPIGSAATTEFTSNPDCRTYDLILQVDDSADTLTCSYSDDNGSNWISLPAASNDMSCAGGDCQMAAMGSSSGTSYTNTFDITNISTSTTLTSLGSPSPPPDPSNILWNASYDGACPWSNTWMSNGSPTHPQFAGIPAYGRPTVPSPNCTSADSSYFGDGSLVELVTSPVRNGTRAVKITVKNAANGGGNAVNYDNGVEYRRRSELTTHLSIPNHVGIMQYQTEYWMSMSYYIPSDWDLVNGNSGWGPLIFQVKSPCTNEISPTMNLAFSNSGWSLRHSWTPDNCPNTFQNDNNPSGSLAWWHQMTYNSETTDSSLIADMVNESATKAWFADHRRGEWTDFVINVLPDGRSAAEGGVGFMDLWGRHGSDAWVKLLEVRPRTRNIGGHSFASGIWYKVSGSTYGPIAGMYMAKENVLPSSNNRVLYHDNIKIGSAQSEFQDMSPDGSTP